MELELWSLSVLGLFAAWDWRDRNVPFWPYVAAVGMTLAAVMGGFLAWSWLGAMIAFLVMWTARLPGGDQKVMALVGGLLPVTPWIWVILLTAHGLVAKPGRPFLPWAFGGVLGYYVILYLVGGMA